MQLFKKKTLRVDEEILIFDIQDEDANKVKSFYTVSPFPNFEKDNKSSVLKKGNNNFLAKNVKNFIGIKKKNILELGCGTGLLSNYFAIGTNNKIYAADLSLESLKIASRFSKENNIKNITYVNLDVLDDLLPDNYFDFIWCNGVLHHTKNPYKSFEYLTKSLKKDGYILIGLYNKFSRVRTYIRKFFYKIFGKKYILRFDPVLRNLKKNDSSIESWINDQYHHPLESDHTFDEVLDWFKKNKIKFINSIPSCDFENNSHFNFLKKNESEGSFFTRFFSQIFSIFSKIGSDGGLFIFIGKKM